jgi:thioredoxin 1
MLESLLNFIMAHPMLVIASIFIAFRLYRIFFPLKEIVIEGSRVKAIESLADLTQELSTNKTVAVDFYAPWCPGCVYAAPDYARLSKEYTNVLFLKVNTDIAREISSHYQIEALPTFKIFSSKTEVASLVGFNKKDFISKLEAAGGTASVLLE